MFKRNSAFKKLPFEVTVENIIKFCAFPVFRNDGKKQMFLLGMDISDKSSYRPSDIVEVPFSLTLDHSLVPITIC